jgi:ABC-type sugar transport system ATPase subunit
MVIVHLLIVYLIRLTIKRLTFKPKHMILRAENLVKTYKGRSVVKGISVEVNQGEIVGLLGPNGAGKTTSFI